MNPTVTLNFGDVPTDDEYTLGFGFDGWSESKESESGALPTMTTQRQPSLMSSSESSVILVSAWSYHFNYAGILKSYHLDFL
jgi:hypothetical protein